jgi:hypothetical protein
MRNPLDPEVFPHIVEGVFDFADRRALCALRGASREFHSRADALLFKHVATCAWATYTCITSPSGQRLPVLPIVHGHPARDGLPSDVWERKVAERMAAFQAKLVHVRAVDYIVGKNSPTLTALFRFCLQPLEVVRIAGQQVPDVHSATLVHKRFLNKAAKLPPLTSSVRRVVIDLSWTLGHFYSHRLLAAEPLFATPSTVPDEINFAEVSEAVLILNPANPNWPIYDPPNFLSAIMQFPKRQETTHKIVGAEKIPPEHLGLLGRPRDEEAYLEDIKVAAARLQVGPDRKVEFLSYTQWEKEAGPYILERWQ